MRHICWILWASIGLAACQPYSHLPEAPPASYEVAEDALRRGDFETAVEGLTRYLAEGESLGYRPRAYYQLAQAEFGLQQYQETLDTLAQLNQEYPTLKGPQAPALAGDAHYALGNRVDAILSWEQAWSRGVKVDHDILRPRIERAMKELSGSELSDVAGSLTEPALREMLGADAPAALVSAPPHGTADAEPAAAAAVVEDGDENRDAAADAVAPAPELESGTRVACVLLLTGPDRQHGRQALSALRHAFADAPDSLVVRDTGGDPAEAAQLFARLATDPSIVAVIGPQRHSDVAVIAPQAERLGIPLLLLSDEEGFAGRYVLRAPRAAGADVTAFAAALRQQSGRAPAAGEEEAYAAAMLVRRAIAAGATSRAAMLEHLRAGAAPAGNDGGKPAAAPGRAAASERAASPVEG